MNDALHLLFEGLFSLSLPKTQAEEESVARYEH